MEKKKSVIEKFIHLVNKQYKSIEKSLDEASNFSETLSLIDKIFVSEEIENLDFLLHTSPEDFNRALTFLVKDEEEDLITGAKAAYFLLSNGIDLVQAQEEKIKELNYRASLKRRTLKKAIERREKTLESLEQYSWLEQKLQEVSVEGVLDRETIQKVFEILGIKEEDKGDYLNEILRFNQERFLGLPNKGKEAVTEEVEMLSLDDDQEDILDMEENAIAKESLEEVLTAHGYELSTFKDEQIELLLQKGDIEKIEAILTSIEKNHLGFVRNSKSKSLLVDFLLESDSDLIDEMCKIFNDSHVNGEYLKSYKSVFFPSSLEEGILTNDGSKKKRESKSSIRVEKSAQRQKPVGRSKHFLENLRILESLGCDRKVLLENQVKLLTDSPSKLLRNIAELRLYEFPIESDHFPLSTLSAPRIMELTDGFIEVGEENYILTYSSRLTAYVDGTIERIAALKKAGLPYSVEMGGERRLLRYVTDRRLPCGLTEDQINESIPKDSDAILAGNKYNSLLDEHLPSVISEITLNDPTIQNIEQRYKNSEWSYRINDVLISRKKLLRNYEFLMNQDFISREEKDTEQILLVSALYNSKLNMDQIEKVNNGLISCMALGGKDGVLKK